MKEAKERNEAAVGDATKRIACIGMNWAHLSMKDLFKIFNSALPYSSPLNVKLCKTRIGRERLGDDNTFVKSCEEGSIRECYVAVAEFEDVEDSKQVYATYDGAELGCSGMVFDLRFVPDSLDLRNVCDEVSSDGEWEEKDFRAREKDSDEDSGMGFELERLFKEKEIDFGLASKLVDVSDDEDVPSIQDELVVSPDSKRSELSESISDDFSDDFNREAPKNKKPKKKEAKVEDIEPIPRSKPTDECDGFVFDPKDKRFEAIFEDDDFAIDPTHPEYKRKGGLKEILDEKRRRLKDNID
ncbi:hypothetical protein EHEL_090370 [Encephalitozoon hellem ATCC 50504]|uniref:NUC153 domain-containing protein n=1 Tax=Encephalitozoon hellem TaxID=27973 RepID=A0A9Q9C4D0_ENCHE|nr:uncharacterized protein EHEL_090370 [Encephalitozoon hellem ATCC 50504]AFM98933.1 hypothetical protein EHEL_090370 [Encephalitozoon hellem ATCC 50504]UTX43946.1 NUC153 domain-containing protein [Encephalitozoon hellem]WEL39430.1 NUC153 domain-containing protein [Encephalitozoon hellem]|eukprot:XP_003887914.1 hypothetical protein EHEL_090370 [Encephalitozoon hellem ATCC 50504]